MPVRIFLLLVGLMAAAASAQPPSSYNAATGAVRSQRWNSGVPLGGIGCGTFRLLTDGTISQATINNNWNRPTGDLPGCFAAVWTNAGGKITARALVLQSPYRLPAVAAMDYRGLFPQAFVDYPDPALPLTIRLRAFSSLIPRDPKNSAVPAALFVFTLKNELRGPVEASVALSWEALLGVGGSVEKGVFGDRTGNTITPADSERIGPGVFGLRLGSPDLPPVVPDRLRYNARGSYALLAQATQPETQVTTAGWNTLDAAPGWWTQFARDGTVGGTVGEGKEGSVHPAGVVALKVTLRDRETREIPFVVAWHTPRFYTLPGTEYGHFYEKSFPDALAVGRYALENRLLLAALTDEWQNRLLRSSLPPWLVRRLINDSAPLFTNTILTRDSGRAGTQPGPPLFGMLASPTDGQGALGALDRRLVSNALLAAWFPALNLQELRQFAALRAPSGMLPLQYGSLDRAIVLRPEDASPGARPDAPDLASIYAFQTYRRYRQTGEQSLLDELYPVVKRALQATARRDTDGDGIPEGPSVFEDLAPPGLFSYTATVWLAGLRIGERLADVMQDKPFAAECASTFSRAQKTVMERLWNGRYLRMGADSNLLFFGPLAGQWMADAVEAGDLLPTEVLMGALDSLIALNDRAAPFGPPMRVNPDGTLTEDRRGRWTFSMAFQAALYATRGRADAGLSLMERIDHGMTERARAPWDVALDYRADTGEVAGERTSMTAPASWSYLEALSGYAYDAPSGRLTLAPSLPSSLKTLVVPVFAPTFWGWMEYRPSPRRTSMMFRLDRMMTLTSPADIGTSNEREEPGSLSKAAGLLVRQVVLPPWTGSATPQLTASLDRAPSPGRLEREEHGRLVFTFETPVRLTAGQRLEFLLR